MNSNPGEFGKGGSVAPKKKMKVTAKKKASPKNLPYSDPHCDPKKKAAAKKKK